VRTPRDDAQYVCVAENGVGDAVDADAILKVYESKYQECLYLQCFLYRVFHNVLLDYKN
jgi:hypothetical protein